MKAVLLASVATLLYLAFVTVAFRAAAPRRRALAMLRLFVGSLPPFVVIYLLLPADLGILPPFLTEPIWLVDVGFALFVYAAGFFGGSLQLYNLAERGFSLRILMDIVEAPAGGMTVQDVRREYSRGHGIAWMFEKRLADMQAGDLIAIERGVVVPRPRGLKMARFAGRVRDFLHLENKV